MLASGAAQLQRIAEAVKRLVGLRGPFDQTLPHCKVVRGGADLIREAFESGAFQSGAEAEVGDYIRSVLLDYGHGPMTITLRDGSQTPLWMPLVWYGVLERIAPELPL